MFDNVGGKMKKLAKIVCYIGIGVSVIMMIVTMASLCAARQVALGIVFGLLTLLLGFLISWIGCWSLYAFGEITENLQTAKKDREELLNEIRKLNKQI